VKAIATLSALLSELLFSCKPGTLPLPVPLASSYQIVLEGGWAPPVEALDAVLDWEANVAVKFYFPEPPGPAPGTCENCIYATLSTSAETEAVCFGAPAESGCAIALPLLTNSSAIWVTQDIPVPVRKWAWRHELGHAMGLFHDGPGTVMYPKHSDASYVVTAQDALQWRRIRGSGEDK